MRDGKGDARAPGDAGAPSADRRRKRLLLIQVGAPYLYSSSIHLKPSRSRLQYASSPPLILAFLMFVRHAPSAPYVRSTCAFALSNTSRADPRAPRPPRPRSSPRHGARVQRLEPRAPPRRRVGRRPVRFTLRVLEERQAPSGGERQEVRLVRILVKRLVQTLVRDRRARDAQGDEVRRQSRDEEERSVGVGDDEGGFRREHRRRPELERPKVRKPRRELGNDEEETRGFSERRPSGPVAADIRTFFRSFRSFGEELARVDERLGEAERSDARHDVRASARGAYPSAAQRRLLRVRIGIHGFTARALEPPHPFRPSRLIVARVVGPVRLRRERGTRRVERADDPSAPRRVELREPRGVPREAKHVLVRDFRGARDVPGRGGDRRGAQAQDAKLAPPGGGTGTAAAAARSVVVAADAQRDFVRGTHREDALATGLWMTPATPETTPSPGSSPTRSTRRIRSSPGAPSRDTRA